MKSKRRQHDNKFKARIALEAIRGTMSLAEIASHYQVHSSQIVRWKKRAIDGLVEIFANSQEKATRDAEEVQAELYRSIGQLKVELDWVKKKSGSGY